MNKIDPRMAADLEQIRVAQEVNKKAAEQRAEAEALNRVAAWDRAMQRAFKGIMPRPTRHAFLRRAADRMEADRDQ